MRSTSPSDAASFSRRSQAVAMSAPERAKRSAVLANRGSRFQLSATEDGGEIVAAPQDRHGNAGALEAKNLTGGTRIELLARGVGEARRVDVDKGRRVALEDPLRQP